MSRFFLVLISITFVKVTTSIKIALSLTPAAGLPATDFLPFHLIEPPRAQTTTLPLSACRGDRVISVSDNLQLVKWFVIVIRLVATVPHTQNYVYV